MSRMRDTILIIMAISNIGLFGCSQNSADDTTATPAETAAFTLASDVGIDGGTLPTEYTCDGNGSTPALSWSNEPIGTLEYALMMTTLPGDGTTRWNWVLYHIPATTTGLAKNVSGVGTLGTGGHGTTMAYDPPCSQGPGPKVYTFTLYALSGSPSLTVSPEEVTGEVLTNAISSMIIGTAALNLSYSRP